MLLNKNKDRKPFIPSKDFVNNNNSSNDLGSNNNLPT